MLYGFAGHSRGHGVRDRISRLGCLSRNRDANRDAALRRAAGSDLGRYGGGAAALSRRRSRSGSRDAARGGRGPRRLGFGYGRV